MENLSLFDSHAHLNWPDYEADMDKVLLRAHQAGVQNILCVGTSLEMSERGVELSEAYDRIYASIGVHPHEAKEMNDATLDALKALAKRGKVVAVGETGLDFYRNYSPREVQVSRFKEQVELAKRLGLPLIIHNRQADEEVLGILRRANILSLGGVFHCFSTNLHTAKEAMRLGFYISFAGNLTYKNAPELKEVARAVPIEKTLIETDCPFLAPEPHRGRRNEPSHVRRVAEVLAEIHGLTLEDVARITTLNAVKLFRLEEGEEIKVAYQIRKSLYLNITNRCTLACIFCGKNRTYTVKGHYLKLPDDPTIEEVIEVVGDPTRYEEVVFCGYGEPLLRLDAVKAVAKVLKEKGAKVRVNTDGLANLVYGRNILPELAGLVDSISVSLNAEDAEKYAKLCPSSYGPAAYYAVKDFIKEAKRYIPEVIATIVTLPRIDEEACRKIVEEELGVIFRARAYNQVG